MDMRNKFKCEQCDRAYFYKSSLKKHLMVHDKEQRRLNKSQCQDQVKLEESEMLLETSTSFNSSSPQEGADSLNLHQLINSSNNILMDYKLHHLANQQLKDINYAKVPSTTPALQQFPSYTSINNDAPNINFPGASLNYLEYSSHDEHTPMHIAADQEVGFDQKRFLDMLHGQLFGNNGDDQRHSNSDIMSEIDPREYKLIKAMRSKDLVFIDSDDEEEPVKQVKSAPATFKTEMIAFPNDNRFCAPSYNIENIFALDSNCFKEKDIDSLFIVREKDRFSEAIEETEYYNEY